MEILLALNMLVIVFAAAILASPKAARYLAWLLWRHAAGVQAAREARRRALTTFREEAAFLDEL
jgi:hypothetical protein